MSAPFFLTWLAGTLLPLGALWLVYRLALRGERCFGYNRALLLLAPVLADRAAAAAEAPEAHAAPYPTLLARLAARQLGGPAYSTLLQPFHFSFTLTRIAMLQNQTPVRRWKQWLVLPVLGALSFAGGHAASAQAGPVPDKPQTTPALSEAVKKARHEELSRKMREALHQDSLRTGGKFEPGTKQQFTITNVNKPGGIVVTVTRVKLNQLDGRVTKDASYKEQADFKESADSHVYTYVEQMPQLPGGGNMAAIMKQIQANLVYPNGERKEGRVFVIFTVSATGEVHDARIIKGLSDSYDAATLAAVEKLPRFVPGQQAGQPVAVSFTVPILFKNTP